ncbi:glyoxylate reductase/hydroxypyruvate reductase [Capsaspora owczarzaki ATCC 30864]|uniref:Glyoxylate reductase/hydroxypyruvate reductase n=1 Tax=Capsaspora owczarzaki (strain ATCC 30864) TaxID=595528 RepID=A0A0D2X102_CAPO3|nr:glyoxylate reductase/hydroxypyruvate reductase [Capsaspora owczarzaki ATCC 30864]KJE89954.1 glyoxylate reductase/hydroxypyruvate reductase [Capsaspora owczarzaki ATCC 30864]|eukprot:XP_004349870.1 glyoxylate reductase/hydroxypyruvate reductase [Capsaspora owczarzaki ATCC 30864]
MQRILVTRQLTEPAMALLRSGAAEGKYILDEWASSGPMPRPELLRRAAGASGLLITLSDKINGELLDAAGPQLKVVSTVSVGYDHVGVHECTARGVQVGNTPDVLTDATADLTVSLLLSTARLLPTAAACVKNGRWGPWHINWMCGADISGSTVGIVGLGRIGAAVARRLAGFNIGKLLYSGRNPAAQALVNHATVRFVNDDGSISSSPIPQHTPLEQLLRESDFVIATCALTDDTKLMFNKERFALMKPTATFVNSARGGIVDQDALYEALTTGRIARAGLDVTSPEPLPPKHPLLTLDNCLVLPHIGSATFNTRNAMCMRAVQNLYAGIAGQKVPFGVQA